MNIGTGPGLSTYVLGETSGQPSVTLTNAQIPQHNHLVQGYAGTTQDPGPTVSGWLGNETIGGRMFSSSAPDQQFAQTMVTVSGGGQPHNNEQPYLVMNFCIALFGIFPSRN